MPAPFCLDVQRRDDLWELCIRRAAKTYHGEIGREATAGRLSRTLGIIAVERMFHRAKVRERRALRLQRRPRRFALRTQSMRSNRSPWSESYELLKLHPRAAAQNREHFFSEPSA